MLGKNITDQLQSNATVIIHAVNPSVKLQQNAVPAQSVSMQRLVLITCYLRNCKQVYDVINSIYIYVYIYNDKSTARWSAVKRCGQWSFRISVSTSATVDSAAQLASP